MTFFVLNFLKKTCSDTKYYVGTVSVFDAEKYLNFLSNKS